MAFAPRLLCYKQEQTDIIPGIYRKKKKKKQTKKPAKIKFGENLFSPLNSSKVGSIARSIFEVKQISALQALWGSHPFCCGNE